MQEPKLPNPKLLLLAFALYILVGFFAAVFLNYAMGAH